jgi:hypothetical protein
MVYEEGKQDNTRRGKWKENAIGKEYDEERIREKEGIRIEKEQKELKNRPGREKGILE